MCLNSGKKIIEASRVSAASETKLLAVLGKKNLFLANYFQGKYKFRIALASLNPGWI